MFRTTFAATAAAFLTLAAPAAAGGTKAHVHSDPASAAKPVRAGASQLAGAPTPSETLPSRWCGAELAADGTDGALDNGSHRYHAVYFVPADRPSRLAELGGTFQRDAMHASALIERSYGRAIRFDMGTRCGPQYLDITTVRLRQTVAELERLAAEPTALYLEAADAAAAVLPASPGGGAETNYLGWFDGPAPAGVCGQAELIADTRRSGENHNNRGGRLALVYRQGDHFCDGDVARHEIAHTLGATMARAPHATAGGHVGDALEDTMASPSAPQVASGMAHGEFFDYGNDDYWGDLPWWTVDMSAFLCPTADCNVAPGYAAPAPRAAVTQSRKRRACRRARTSSVKRRLGCPRAARRVARR